MIIFAHPRSGSTALLKIFKWINETHYDKKTLDLGEFLNIGALHNSKKEHSSVMNRGRDSAHMWRPFYQPLIQHFIHDERIEPKEHCYCEIDTKVFDMDFSSPDFIKRSNEIWPSKGSGFAHGDPIGHPLKETTKIFTKEEVFPHMILQQKLRLKYIRTLQQHNISFVAKVFPGYKKFFERFAEPYYSDIKSLRYFDTPKVYNNDCIIISDDPVRSMLSQAILLKYKYKGTIHNYRNEKSPVEVEPGIVLNKDFVESRCKVFGNIYRIVRHRAGHNIITKDTLFKTQRIELNNEVYDLKEYFDTVTSRQYEMPYTTDLANYFTNSKEAIQELKTYILENYPDVAEEYLIL